MCEFFSFCTEPEGYGGKRFYFDWKYRKAHLEDENDSHSLICKHSGLDEDKCNKYEFNPLTKVFKVDKINSEVDDRIQAEDWVNKLDFKRVVEPLVVKPIVNPFELPDVEAVTPEMIDLLKQWSSVWASVWASVWDSVWDSVGAYVSSLFPGITKWKYIDHPPGQNPFQPGIDLWKAGLVPSYDGEVWRLHAGEKAEVVYEWKTE